MGSVIAELLHTINNYKIVKYLLMIQALLLSGILIIFCFQSQAFYTMSISKLVLFALSITVPIFMMNIILSSYLYKFSSNTSEEKIEILLILSSIMTSLCVYCSIIFSCSLKYNFSGFLKVLSIVEITVVIELLIKKFYNKLCQYVLKKDNKSFINKHNNKPSDNDRTHILGE